MKSFAKKLKDILEKGCKSNESRNFTKETSELLTRKINVSYDYFYILSLISFLYYENLFKDDVNKFVTEKVNIENAS